jgi:enterochelin esterase-like enzyme
MRAFTLSLLLCSAAFAEKIPVEKLLEMAKSHSPGLDQALKDSLGSDAVQKGTAVDGVGGSFLWAVESASQPKLRIDYTEPVTPWKAGGNVWVYQGEVKTGTVHRFLWILDGKSFGGKNEIPAYGTDSFPHPGVPEGKLTGPIAMESKIYPGMKTNVWYYVPAQWDGTTPLPVQVFGDGEGYVNRMNPKRTLEVIDNLTAQKRIPLIVNVFISPGTANGRPMRSPQYDTVSDTYVRYLTEEVLPEIGKSLNLRQDAYSRAIIGQSSGGIAAFNAAYLKSDLFSRAISWIGSFAAIQVSADHPVGGAEYPARVRLEPKRNIRVWLEDGAEDQENPRFGSWPYANLDMANSLKVKGYDYHFSFGVHTHNQLSGNLELPESLPWLWRGYDPAKTGEQFTQEPEEAAKPLWRVEKLNR